MIFEFLKKGILILVIIAAFVLPNPFQTATYTSEPTIYDEKDKAERWLRVADLFWAERDFDRALIFINKSLSHFPLKRALWLSVNANSMKHEYFNVHLALSKLDTLGVKEAIGQRGYIKMNRQFQYGEGLKDFIKYKEINGLDTYIRAWYIDHYIGMAYHHLEDYENAIKYYNSCIEHEGEEWTVVYNFLYRGLAQEALGYTEEAIQSYIKMNAHCDICPEGHYFLADLYRRTGRYDDAQLEYADAYSLRHNVYSFNSFQNLSEDAIERQWLMYGKTLVMVDESSI